MDRDTLLALSIAQLYGHHANYAGTPRQAVADGYSCVDAVFSALLKYKGIKQHKNHWHKLNVVKANFPKVFDAVTIKDDNSTLYMPGTNWQSLEAYYREWLSSRYNDFALSAALSSSRVKEALGVLEAALRYLAAEENVDVYDLKKEVSTLAHGFDLSLVQVAVSNAHDELFADAEAFGEEYGSKLGVKMAAATNFCDLDVMAGDTLTQSIIRNDEEIAQEAARVYHAFVALTEKIQEKRLHSRQRAQTGGNFATI